MLKIAALCLVFVGVASAGWTCELCEDAIKEVIQYADGQEGKAEQILDKDVCDRLSGFLEGVCKEGVHAGVPMIIKDLGQGVTNPQVLCSHLHLCSSGTEWEAFPDSRLFQFGGFCKQCETLVNGLEGNAKNIESAVAALCAQAPANLAPLCQRFGDVVKNLVNKFGANADAVCSKIPGCQSAEDFVDAVAPKSNPTLCEYCEEAINVVKSLVSEKVPTIIDDLETLCNKLPSSEAGICTALLDQYGTMLLDKVVSLLNAEQICTGIKLCSSAIQDYEISPAEAEALRAMGNPSGVNWDPVECNFCKMAFSFIQNNFMSQDFINALLMDIAKACKDIKSADTQQQCMSIIGTYGDMIMNYVKQLIGPDHICPMIKMCPNSSF